MIGGRLGFLRNRTAWVLAVALVALVAARHWQLRQGAAGPSAGRQPRAHLLVSAEVLAANLEREDVRVVDLRSRQAYREGHIPGAVHVPFTALWTTREGVPGLLPGPESAQALIRQAGIDADTVVAGYDDDNGLRAARLFWALDVFGQGNGHVLDGGWSAWVEGGHAVTTEVPRVQPGDFVVEPRTEALAVLDEVGARLDDAGTRLVDARSPAEYLGEDVRTRRGGHVPGAYNVPWKRHLDPQRPGRFRSLDALARLYAPLDLDGAERVITYSRTHVRAAHTYFVLRLLGYDHVAGYDGSWAEWGSRPDTVVSTEPEALPEGAAVASSAADGSARPGRAGALRPGLSMEQARRIVGPPPRVEQQQTCWGTQTTWIFRDGVAGRDGPVRLVFSAGSLSRIE